MKKTIFVSVIAFLFLFGCTKAYNDLKVNPNENQLKSASNKKVTTAHTGSYDVVFDFWCGDKVIDRLSGTLNFHCVMQYQNGGQLFMNMTYEGSLTGLTGEVFKFKEISIFNASAVKYHNGHINAIGDKGSHIVISYTEFSEEPWFVLNNAKCE